MIFGTVMVADDWSTSDGVSDKDGSKNKVDVHDGSVSGYAVFSAEFHQLKVIHGIHDGTGQTCHQFGGTIGTGFPQNTAVKSGFTKTKPAGIFPGKIKQWSNTANTFTTDRSNRGTCQSPAEDSNKEQIQNHIRNTCGDDHGKSQFWLFSCDKKALKYILQHKGSQGNTAQSAI